MQREQREYILKFELEQCRQQLREQRGATLHWRGVYEKDMKAEASGLHSKKEILAINLRASEKKREAVELENLALKKGSIETEQQIMLATTDNMRLSQENTRLLFEHVRMREDVGRLEGDENRLGNENGRLGELNMRLQEEADSLKDQVRVLNASIERLKTQHMEEKNTLEAQVGDADYFKGEVRVFIDTVATLKAQHSEEKKSLEAQVADADSFKGEVRVLINKVATLKAQHSEEKKALETSIQQLRESLQAMNVYNDRNQHRLADGRNCLMIEGLDLKGTQERNQLLAEKTIRVAQGVPVAPAIYTLPTERADLFNNSTIADALGKQAEGIASEKKRKRPNTPWNDSFKRLQQYHAEHGHCHFPKKYDTALYYWASQQKTQLCDNEGCVDQQERIDKLNSVGFWWGWDHPTGKIADALDNQTTTGRDPVDKMSVVAKNRGPSSFENRAADDDDQTKNKNNNNESSASKFGTVEPEATGETSTIADGLENQGATGCDAAIPSTSERAKTRRRDRGKPHLPWEDNFKRLQQFHAEHGHCNVPKRYDSSLFYWIHTQRGRLRVYKGFMVEQIDKLNDLGFWWGKLHPLGKMFVAATDRRPSSFENRAAAADDDQTKTKSDNNEHSVAKSGTVEPEATGKASTIADGLENQAATGRNDTTPSVSERTQASQQERGKPTLAWEDIFKRLQQFHAEHGHCNVPEKYDKALHHWNDTQRYRLRVYEGYKKERIDKLLTLGFSFSWRLSLDTISAATTKGGPSIMEHGAATTDIDQTKTDKNDENSIIAWFENFECQKQGETALQQNDCDEEVGTKRSTGRLVENARTKQLWEDNFKRLQQFHAEHGHCNVPAKYDKSLHHWNETQRHRLRVYEGYKKERIDKLITLGFSFSWRLSLDKISTAATAKGGPSSVHNGAATTDVDKTKTQIDDENSISIWAENSETLRPTKKFKVAETPATESKLPIRVYSTL